MASTKAGFTLIVNPVLSIPKEYVSKKVLMNRKDYYATRILEVVRKLIFCIIIIIYIPMTTVPGSKKHFCNKFTRIGIWEGVNSIDEPTNGPIVRCDECGAKRRLLWETWHKLPKDKKSIRIKEKHQKFQSLLFFDAKSTAFDF